MATSKYELSYLHVIDVFSVIIAACYFVLYGSFIIAWDICSVSITHELLIITVWDMTLENIQIGKE